MSKHKPDYKASPGTPLPLGVTWNNDTANFAFVAGSSTGVSLVFTFDLEHSPEVQLFEIAFDSELNRTGDTWHISLDTGGRSLRYGYRVDGDSRPQDGIRFSPETIVIDPYCTSLIPRSWGAGSVTGAEPICLAEEQVNFDWQGDRPLNTPAAETVIYEMHVRGFTRDTSSNVSAPGTYRGVIEKIPYLQELGITAVELLPVNEWDETDNKFYHPDTSERLPNYWGYNPLSFFALRSGLAANPAEHLSEFKTMVRELHGAGIEVIIDLVFNHTGESDLQGITSGFRAIDNALYYMIDPASGGYHNFSGCGNTVSCNHPVVLDLILTALRYLVSELHVDGFRFDLAAIFSRDTDGTVLTNPPLVELIAKDPVLQSTKIIAEPWDASGLYQVGSFSSETRWVEWNGRFRDDVRRFMAGHPDTVRSLATRLAGSSDLYQSNGRGPLNSINFITCHDGFTLYDLVSYNEKVNRANGEENRDGENHNLSWNSGHEGDPCPDDVALLRQTRTRTFTALLLLSQGMPMITAGDEFGRTQQGNNNCWCQDNELSWLDWSLAEKNQGLLRFFRKCIGLRKNHAVFRRTEFFQPPVESDRQVHPDITWQSLTPGQQDWSEDCRTLAFLLHGSPDRKSVESDFFIMVNGSTSEEAHFIIPEIPVSSGNVHWLHIVNTAVSSPSDFLDADQAPQVGSGTELVVPPMGLVVLQSRPTPRN